jgi:hypothetical protein
MSEVKTKKVKPAAPVDAAPTAAVELPPVGSAARKALILQGVIEE